MPVPIFDVNNHILDYIPRRKRKPFWIGWFKGLLSQIDRLNIIFNDFRNSSTDLGYWNNLISYSVGDRVRTLFGTFESISILPNLGNNPLVDNGTNWIKVLNSFIGATERASFTVQKLSFERALNRQFQGVLTDNGYTGFKQPTSIDPGIGYLPLSDIFISIITTSFPSGVVFPESTTTGILFTFSTSSTGFTYETPLYTTFTYYKFGINIPTSVYNSLGTTNEIRESIVRNFADKINRIGITYEIILY